MGQHGKSHRFFGIAGHAQRFERENADGTEKVLKVLHQSDIVDSSSANHEFIYGR